MFKKITAHTVPFGVHADVHSVRVDVVSSECTEHGRVHLCSVGIASLGCSALECEVSLCHPHEGVFAKTVEGVLEAIQRADVWVSVEPTCGNQAK